MQIFNINADYQRTDPDAFKASCEAFTMGAGVADKADGNMWIAVCGNACYPSIPLDEELKVDEGVMLSRISDLEVAASEHGMSREGPQRRQRKARKGVAQSDFVVPTTFRVYKKLLKDAVKFDIELLNEQGLPRAKNDVANDIKEAAKLAKGEKSPEEKLAIATQTWLSIAANVTDNAKLEAAYVLIRDAVRAKGVTA